MEAFFEMLSCSTCGCSKVEMNVQPEPGKKNPKQTKRLPAKASPRGRKNQQPLGITGTVNDQDVRSAALAAAVSCHRVESGHECRGYVPVAEPPESAESSQTQAAQRRSSLTMGWGSMTGTKSTARRKSMSEMGRSFVRTFASRSPEPQSQEEKPTSPSAKRRGSFIGRTLQTFRNPSPEPGAPLASGKGRRKSREDNSDEKSGAVYYGDKCVVLYDYFAESSAPFPPDTRRELTVTKVRKARSCKCEALGDLTVFLGRGQDWTSLRRDLTDGAWFENQGEPRSTGCRETTFQRTAKRRTYQPTDDRHEEVRLKGVRVARDRCVCSRDSTGPSAKDRFPALNQSLSAFP